MKYTITKYLCDRCGNELKGNPAPRMSFAQNICEEVHRYSLDVTIEYASSTVSPCESHLCPKCKLYALNEAKKILEHELAEEQQKGEQQ